MIATMHVSATTVNARFLLLIKVISAGASVVMKAIHISPVAAQLSMVISSIIPYLLKLLLDLFLTKKNVVL